MGRCLVLGAFSIILWSYADTAANLTHGCLITLGFYLPAETNEDKDDDALSAMEESSLSESEDDEIISSIRPSKKVIYSSESDMSDKPSDGAYFY